MSGGGIGLLSEISYASERRPDLVGGCVMSTGDLVVGDADGELNHRHTDCHDLQRTWVKFGAYRLHNIVLIRQRRIKQPAQSTMDPPF